MFALYIIAILLAILFIILLIKVKIGIDLVLDGVSLEWNAVVTLFGGAVKIDLKKVAKKPKTEKVKEEIKDEIIKGKFEDLFKKGLDIARMVVRSIKKILVIEEFTTNAKIGLDDPAYTAMLYGTSWGFVGGLYGILSDNVTLKSWNFDILPDFDNPKIYIQHRSVYTARPLQILMATLLILINNRKTLMLRKA